ncbi:MAG: ribosomal protein [Candidatus Saccharibacteria bacterium]|nr:ribosomal protein [Candidatus Saccharibacteria bacterium]
MKYNELTIDSHRQSCRVGRGIAAGQGKTAGRGTKGQKSRTGSGRRPGFEGGQNPLMQRIPKLRGFTSHRTPAETVYTGQLEALKGSTVDNTSLVEAGLISSPNVRVKLLVKGDLKKKLSVSLQMASKEAIKAIEKAGGSFKPINQIGRLPKKSQKDTDTK